VIGAAELTRGGGRRRTSGHLLATAAAPGDQLGDEGA